MRTFEQYPVYINHPGRWEAVRLRQRDHVVDKGDFKMMMWLDHTGKRRHLRASLVGRAARPAGNTTSTVRPSDGTAGARSAPTVIVSPGLHGPCASPRAKTVGEGYAHTHRTERDADQQ